MNEPSVNEFYLSCNLSISGNTSISLVFENMYLSSPPIGVLPIKGDLQYVCLTYVHMYLSNNLHRAADITVLLPSFRI
jgi:hypothetical protein